MYVSKIEKKKKKRKKKKKKKGGVLFYFWSLCFLPLLFSFLKCSSQLTLIIFMHWCFWSSHNLFLRRENNCPKYLFNSIWYHNYVFWIAPIPFFSFDFGSVVSDLESCKEAQSFYLREAAKKVIFLVYCPLRGAGAVKGLSKCFLFFYL